MGDGSFQNRPAETANKVIHDLIFDVAVKAAEGAIIGQLPFLGWPILKQLHEALLNYLATKIYESLAKGVTFSIIDVQIDSEAKAVNVAAENLRNAISGGNVGAIEVAKKDFSDAFAKLVHIDGSARP